MKHLYIKFFVFLILLYSTLTFTACSSFPGQATPTPDAVEEFDATPLVSATGLVVPSEWATLSMTSSGIIEDVLVEQGEQVNAGDVLVRLRGGEDLAAAIKAAEFEVISAQKALDDLSTQAEASRTKALENISLASKQVHDAQYQYDNFIIPSNQEGLTAMEAVDEMREHLATARQAFEPYKFKSEYDSGRKKYKENLDQAQSDYNSAVRRLELETTLRVAQERLDKARKDYEIWKKGPDPKDVKVAKARLDNANAALAVAESALEELELRATINGTISELYVRPGEWVVLGQPALLLADLAHLRVETTDLNEIDVARVQIGDPVTVTFDALPEVIVNGVIKRIAPKSTKGSGVNYAVIVELENIPEDLLWGMTAFVDIAVH